MDGYWLHEINTEEQTAEILDYVESSDPHVSVWIKISIMHRKSVKFPKLRRKINQFVTGRVLKRMELHPADEFDIAYAQGIAIRRMNYI